MTTIDHRILIPAAPDVVWEFISDITRNPQWQVDCFEVIFLTSKRDGPGLRWRYSTPGGDEYVIAVTAWYKGLGYEYYFVDGVPFRENKGRIRLQEIPEGTIVQWTFTYEIGGVFGGVRNALGMNRQINRTIADSLKQLWQKMKEASAGQSHEAKSLMREAPDVEARSAYQPRHPSALQSQERDVTPFAPETLETLEPLVVEPPISDDDGQNIPVIAEPPLTDEDTRPRRPVEPAASAAAEASEIPQSAIPADLEEEPDFLIDLSRFEPPRDPSDTQPRRPLDVTAEPTPDREAEAVEDVESEPEQEVTMRSPFARPLDEPEPARSIEETEPLTFTPPEVLPDYLPSTEQLESAAEAEADDALEVEEAVESDVSEPSAENELVTAAAIGEVRHPDDEPESAPAIEEATQAAAEPTAEAEPVDVDTVDTAETRTPEETQPAQQPEAPLQTSDSQSIWEIFGVPRPSDVEPTEAVTAETAAPTRDVEEATQAQAEQPSEPIAEPVTQPVVVAREAVTLPALPMRVGLRIVLRRKLVHLRRPSTPERID